MWRKLLRLVPSVRALLLTAVALVTVTLAAAASIVSFGPGGRLAIASEPPAVWIAVAGVVVIFVGMIAAVWLSSRRIRALRRRQAARRVGSNPSTLATFEPRKSLLRACKLLDNSPCFVRQLSSGKLLSKRLQGGERNARNIKGR
jgi:hypothetical protein